MANRHRQPVDPLPDFLGIGAPRAGTTWLHTRCAQHPELWVPPVKELHYFDRSPAYQSPVRLAEPSPLRRMLGRAAPAQQYRRGARRLVWQAFRRDVPGAWRWRARFLLGYYDDRWYASLFREAAGLVKGEITPGYSLLTDADVARVRTLMPDLKIIFLMRDPVDRAWSAVRRRDRSSGELLDLLYTPGILERGNYLHTLRTWEHHFPKEQIFIDFYDRLCEAPGALFQDVCRFLEVDPGALAAEAGGRAVNAAPAAEMPRDVHVTLANHYRDTLRGLSERFGGYPTRWHEAAERVLSEAASSATSEHTRQR